jgi:cyclic nucleotide-binding protein
MREQFASPDPYIRAASLYVLESTDTATDDDFAALDADEHPIVRETVASARRFAWGHSVKAEPTTLAKMIGLKSIALFEGLEPEDLAELARAGVESWFTHGETLCREGELGDELFVLLTGEVSVLRHDGDVDRIVAIEGPGSVIGELAVLDPAPRNATVVASTVAVRALRLCGGPFRQVLNATPALSEVIIRLLARRLRAQNTGARPVADPPLQRR